jgi:predicted MFS family arabinose efflux permease
VRLLRTTLGNRQIARLEAGAAVGSLGGWTFSIVLALYSYYEGGPGAVALAVAARMLPAALIAPAAERILSGSRLRTVLTASALARFVLLEAIALVVANELPFALLLVLAAGFETAGTVWRTAREALLVDLARTPAELAASGARRIVDYAGFLAGALAAGALLASGGLDTAFAASGFAFLVVAAISWRLSEGDRPAPTRVAARERGALIRPQVGVFGATVLVQSMLELLLVVTALDVLGMEDDGVGWLRAAFAAGALVAGALALTLLRRRRVRTTLAASMVLAGAPLALVPAWPATAPVLVMLAAVGGGYALIEAALLTLTQRTATPAALARTAAVEDLVYPVARAAGAGLAAWLVVQFGEQAALVVAGLLLPALALASVRHFGDAEVPERALSLLEAEPSLAGLPPATLESLALCAQQHELAAGEELDPNRFHLIASGEIALDGASDPLGAGDCFGERALLHDGPCGSTATALTPVTALTISRADFMSRVGGVRGRRAAASRGPSATFEHSAQLGMNPP